MKISYLITCHDEVDTLYDLIKRLEKSVDIKNDEIVIIYDAQPEALNSGIAKSDTEGILLNLKSLGDHSNDINIKIICHKLINNYGNHKNFGIEQCTGDFIFQIDADELPSELILGDNLKSIIEENTNIECFLVPRINNFVGVYDKIAFQWGWHLSPSKTIINKRNKNDIKNDEYIFLKNNRYILNEMNNVIEYKAVLINALDPQYRIYKRDYPRISYKRRLHEKVEGFNSYSFLPMEEEYAMVHNKSIEKQVQTNVMYNKQFTQEENKGFKIGYE
jgi:hypothetical protein